MKFEEILVIATLVTGVIWMFDIIWFSKKRKPRQKEFFVIEYSKSFFPVLLLVLLLRSFAFEPFRIPTGSMKPTLLEGDFILVNKFRYGLRLPISSSKFFSISKPERGDVIVFRHASGKDLIKRVVGVSGDRIQYINEKLYINEKEVKQAYSGNTVDIDVSGFVAPVELYKEVLDPQVTHDIYLHQNKNVNYGYKFTDVKVPQNSYFVMGDNRNNSEDSRFWGFVDDKDLLGVAVATWMSWDGHHNDVRWERICRSIK